MPNRRLALSMIAAAPVWLTACSREQGGSTGSAPTTSKSIDTPQAFDTLAKEARGFTAGAMMSAHTVYVLFDPQCPHCSRLWEASLPLQSKIKFVWAPVAILGAKSLPQGAALLQAANPVAAMTAHEQSLLAGQGGTSASADIPDDMKTAILSNTQLLDRLGAESVPYIVAKRADSGEVVTAAGSMGTEALAQFIGLPQP